MKKTLSKQLLLASVLVGATVTAGFMETGMAQDPAPTPAAAATIRAPQGNIEAFWNGFAWSELSGAEQAAWGKLGWNQNSWDNSAQVPAPASEAKQWNGLTPDEQAAATQLGYTESTWNATAPAK
jgi:hypothetical protein